MAAKHDATVEEIKTFVQRRCQNAKLIPGTSGMQPLNHVYNWRSTNTHQQQHRQLSLIMSSGKLKATAYFVRALVISGLSVVKVSGTKPTASIHEPNSVHYTRTPMANNSLPISQGTTQNCYAKSEGK